MVFGNYIESICNDSWGTKLNLLKPMLKGSFSP